MSFAQFEEINGFVDFKLSRTITSITEFATVLLEWAVSVNDAQYEALLECISDDESQFAILTILTYCPPYADCRNRYFVSLDAISKRWNVFEVDRTVKPCFIGNIDKIGSFNSLEEAEVCAFCASLNSIKQ